MFFLRKGGIRLKILKKTGLYQVKKKKASAQTPKLFNVSILKILHCDLFIRNICLILLFNFFFAYPILHQQTEKRITFIDFRKVNLIFSHILHQPVIIGTAYQFDSNNCWSGFLICLLHIFKPGNIISWP